MKKIIGKPVGSDLTPEEIKLIKSIRDLLWCCHEHKKGTAVEIYRFAHEALEKLCEDDHLLLEDLHVFFKQYESFFRDGRRLFNELSEILNRKTKPEKEVI